MARDNVAFVSAQDAGYLYFTNGLRVTKDLREAELVAGTMGRGALQFIYSEENGSLRKNENPSPALASGALIFKDGNGPYQAVIADPRLIESMAFRLYYLKGAGLRYLKLAAHEEDVRDRTILSLFEVHWDGLS